MFEYLGAKTGFFMKTNRRKFIAAALTGGVAASLPDLSFGSENIKEIYARLDEMIRKPVLKTGLFTSPVIIDQLELLRLENSFLCRVRSKDGGIGISVANDDQMKSLYPILVKRLSPFFIGKDARDLESLIEGVYVYQSNYKMP